MVKALLLAVATACCGSLSAQSPAPGSPAEACVQELHTPVRHVNGIIFTRQGQLRDLAPQLVNNATVTLMQDGKLVAKEETHNATFDFTENLTHGSYDLIVEATNHTPTRFRIIVHKPIQKGSKGSLWLTMPSGAGCGEIYYMKRRYVDFETPVETREPAVQLASAVN